MVVADVRVHPAGREAAATHVAPFAGLRFIVAVRTMRLVAQFCVVLDAGTLPVGLATTVTEKLAGTLTWDALGQFAMSPHARP